MTDYLDDERTTCPICKLQSACGGHENWCPKGTHKPTIPHNPLLHAPVSPLEDLKRTSHLQVPGDVVTAAEDPMLPTEAQHGYHKEWEVERLLTESLEQLGVEAGILKDRTTMRFEINLTIDGAQYGYKSRGVEPDVAINFLKAVLDQAC